MTENNHYAGPLAGLTVIDFGHYYAGPMAAMLLADQGATVIRVVKPSGPELPTAQFRVLNRNKKWLTLDLKTEAGKTQAASLVAKADVVIESFRPGVMKRLGLDYASVKKANPGLIYLSLPGFASTDKERAHIQAWEGVVSAAAGLYQETSIYRQLLGYSPVYSTGTPQCSAYGSIHGALAVTAALIKRREAGVGTLVEVPLVDAGMSSLSMNVVMALGFGDLRSPRDKGKPQQVAELLKPFLYSPTDDPSTQVRKLGEAKRAMGLAISPLCTFHTCADGRQIFLWIVMPEHIHRVLEPLGLYRQILKEGFVEVDSWGEPLENDILGFGLSEERRQRYHQYVADAFSQKTAAEWEKLLSKARVPFGIVRSREEWLNLQPMLDAGVNIRLGDGSNQLTVPGRLADISGPSSNGKTPVLMSGYSDGESIYIEQAEALIEQVSVEQQASSENSRNSTKPISGAKALKKGDLLKGVKVLDLSNVVAGPTSSYTLAQYGADVIKLDFPAHQSPGLMKMMMEINQGKRNLLANINSVPGQTLLRKLVGWADLVVHNSLDDTAKRLGVTHAQLQEINPQVVSCQLSCMGGTYRGAWETSRPGFDPFAQLESGLAATYGSLEDPHMHVGSPAVDISAGLSLAFTALLALYQKQATGYAGEGRTSLMRAGSHYQLPWLIAENGRCEKPAMHGQLMMGESWWQRIYQCNDGWLYVGASPSHKDRLAQLVINPQEGDEKAVSEKAISEEDMQESFIQQSCAAWADKLQQAGIGCHRVMSTAENCQHLSRVDNHEADETVDGPLPILCREDHPCGKPVIYLAPTWVRIGEDQSYKRLSPAPRFAEHSVEILAELGYSEGDISELINLGVVYEKIPQLASKEQYFP